MVTILVGVIAALGTILGSLATYFTWRESHTDRGIEQQEERIKNALHPYDLRLIPLEANAKHTPEAMEYAITKAMQPVLTQLTDLGTKMDVLWEVQKQAALDAARILHHPEPARAKLDKLLDAFIEDTMTPEEEIQLRKYLVTIRDWEPGQDVGFPVYQGEQMAAAAILRTMKHMNVHEPEGISRDVAQEKEV